MLFSFSAQHVLFFYYLAVVSAVPRAVIERSAASYISSTNVKYGNSTSSLTHSTSSSLSSASSSLNPTTSKSFSTMDSPTRAGTAGVEHTSGGSYISSGESMGPATLKTSSSSKAVISVSLSEPSKTSGLQTVSSYDEKVASSNSTTASSKEKSPSSSTKDHSSSSLPSTPSFKFPSNHTASGTSSTHSPLITSSSKNGTTSKKATSITSMASYSMFGSQTITRASCKSSTLGKSAADYCRILIGTVQLHYWPTGSATLNKTYPSTIYLEEYDITMTSPSVYFAINTMKATDLCGKQVGPTIKNYAVGYDLTDVYTMQPFASASATTRMGTPLQLQLSDLRTDCPKTTILPSDIFDYQDTNHVVLGDDSECNPILSWPTDLRHAAGDFWTTCGRHWGGELGIFDPPVPVTACTGDASACLYGSNKVSTASATTTKSTFATSPAGDQITTTSASPSPTLSAGPASTGNAGFASLVSSAKSSLALSFSTSIVAAQSTPASSSNSLDSHSQASSSDPQSVIASAPSDPIPQSTSPSLPSPTVVAVVGSNTFSAVPGSSGIILPNGSTASAGNVVTIQDASSSSIVVSVGSSNLFVGTESYFIPTSSSIVATQSQVKPTTPVPIATLSGSSVISAAPGASFIVIGSQTASEGGPAVTDGGNVVKLTPSGVEVGNTNDAAVSMYSIPEISQSSSSLVNVGIIGGQSISVAPASAQASSAAIVGDQTISIDGPVATLSGGNIVSLGSSGVVVQAPAGTITTIPVPTHSANLANIGIINDETISVAAGSSDTSQSPIAVVAGQTISLGGSIATLSRGEIATLVSSGVEIQAPGGIVTTIAVPKKTYTPSTAGFQSSINTAVVAGQTISVETVQGDSVAIIAGQTLESGGPIATLSEGNVVSLGASGMVVQAPSGQVTTIPISKTPLDSGSTISTGEVRVPSISSALNATPTSGTGSAIMAALNSSSGGRLKGMRGLVGLLLGWGTILGLR